MHGKSSAADAHVWCARLQDKSFDFDQRVGLISLLCWIEVQFPFHTFPTNFGLKSDKRFGGLFFNHTSLER
jgi:hypothetical protein